MDTADRSAISKIIKEVDAAVAEEQKLKKKKAASVRAWVIMGFVAVALIALSVYAKNVVIPAKRYERAISLKDSGSTQEAYAMFQQLGDYKNAPAYCTEIEYEDALKDLNDGKFAKAFAALIAIKDYSPAAKVADDLLASFPYLAGLVTPAGGSVFFGRYEQDSNTRNGKENVEWYVLAHEDGRTLLISRFILDAREYSNSNSNKCTLDTWIGNVFFASLFEGEAVEPGILSAGLIRKSDAASYITGNMCYTEPTAFAKTAKGYKKGTDGYHYWLGGETFLDGKNVKARLGGEKTVSGGSDYVTAVQGVRPVIWITYG